MQLYIPAIWMAAGISLFAGVHFTLAGLQRRQEPGFLPFGILCLLLSAYIALWAPQYLTQSAATAGEIERYKVTFLCVIYPVAVWFIGEFTKLRKLWPWLTAASVLFGIFLILNQFAADSVLYARGILRPPIVLPWGERLSNFDAKPTPLASVFFAASYAFFLWAIWRCISIWRAGLRRRALPLAAYLVIQFATVAYSQTIAQLHLEMVTLGEFAFLALVLIMSITLHQELQQRTDALGKSLNTLQVETEQRRKMERRLHHMAYHDYLTDLPNRRLLRKILKGALEHHHATRQLGAIVFLDLDHFKTINDSLGHLVGDALLKQIAERLRAGLQGSRCVSRLGGDEFAVILGNLGTDRLLAEAKALHAAEVLRAGVTRPFMIGNHELVVGVSIGVTLFPDQTEDVTGLIRQADMALYSAKAAGRNTAAVFAAQMQEDASRRLVVEKGLRGALEKRELKLYFQPQVNVAGELIGAEALLRWHHPEYGLIEPRLFIPVAEETGLIHAIGDYVLRGVCECLHKWEQAQLPVPARLALNVSPWQLATAGFARQVKRSIALAGMDASRLTLEITENALLEDMDEVARTIRELSKLGVRFSIDDFGSGYSALASLKKLPLHELKIDRLFITEMRISPPDQFIDTIIAMAYHMGLYVIAEGVETEAQRHALAAMGCHGFQGYLISPPLAVSDFESWLESARLPPEPAGNRQLDLETTP